MSWPLTPKSHNLISPKEFTKIFDGFTSKNHHQERKKFQTFILTLTIKLYLKKIALFVYFKPINKRYSEKLTSVNN